MNGPIASQVAFYFLERGVQRLLKLIPWRGSTACP